MCVLITRIQVNMPTRCKFRTYHIFRHNFWLGTALFCSISVSHNGYGDCCSVS